MNEAFCCRKLDVYCESIREICEICDFSQGLTVKIPDRRYRAQGVSFSGGITAGHKTRDAPVFVQILS